MSEDPFDMLFRAKWNIPQASLAMGKVPCEESWEEMKQLFQEWCKTNPPTHVYGQD
jgi:hypothetical protein